MSIQRAAKSGGNKAKQRFLANDLPTISNLFLRQALKADAKMIMQEGAQA